MEESSQVKPVGQCKGVLLPLHAGSAGGHAGGSFRPLDPAHGPRTVRIPEGADVVIAPDQVLPDGRQTTDGWAEIGLGLAEAAGDDRGKGCGMEVNQK